MKKLSTILLCGLLCLACACKTTQSDEKKDDPAASLSEESSGGGEAAEASEAKEGAEEEVEPCGPDDEMCRVERLGDTSVGWLSEGLAIDTALEKLGEPEQKEARFEEGASGDFLEIWTWPSKGVQADVTAPNMTDPVTTVRSFTVRAPFDGETKRGVGIGSTEQEVLAAYDGLFDPVATRPGELLVAGSVYGGMFFRLEGGEVSEIFVGAGAE